MTSLLIRLHLKACPHLFPKQAILLPFQATLYPETGDFVPKQAICCRKRRQSRRFWQQSRLFLDTQSPFRKQVWTGHNSESDYLQGYRPSDSGNASADLNPIVRKLHSPIDSIVRSSPPILPTFLYCIDSPMHNCNGLSCPHLLLKTATLYPETGSFVAKNHDKVACFRYAKLPFSKQMWTGLKCNRYSSC